MSGMRPARPFPVHDPVSLALAPGTRGTGAAWGTTIRSASIFMPNGPGPHDRGMWFAAGAARVTYMTSRIQNLPEPPGRAR